MKQILLHCCCGPCTIYPLQSLRDSGYRVTGFFYNPNIHPFREYVARLSSYEEMAKLYELPVLPGGEYGLEEFLFALKDVKGDVYEPVSSTRCEICYRLRLERTAIVCKRDGYEAFSTTLLVSPYQNHDMIRQVGERIAEAYELGFVYSDFRPGFRRGQKSAVEAGFYMQKYCGCVFSEYDRYGRREDK